MCGIIVINAKRPVVPLLLDGLRRLEYRGYDSAGIATLVNGRIDRRQAEGKLGNLAEPLERESVPGTIGIGHTRWATHGRRPRPTPIPTPTNASPWCTTASFRISGTCVRTLPGAVIAFETETDTEVVVHLLTDHLDRQMRPQEAVAEALVRLEGAAIRTLPLSRRTLSLTTSSSSAAAQQVTKTAM